MAEKTLTDQEKVTWTLELHDLYRTIRMNHLYYSSRLKWSRRWCAFWETIVMILTLATFVEITVFVSNPTSIPSQKWLAVLIPFLAAAAAFTKFLLPVFQNLERHSRLHSELGYVFSQLGDLETRLKSKDDFTFEMLTELEIHKRRLAATIDLDDPEPNRRRLDRFYKQVNEEIPASTLWVPTSYAG